MMASFGRNKKFNSLLFFFFFLSVIYVLTITCEQLRHDSA